MSIEKACGQLKRDEGYRQFPYKDSRGVLTIGYGCNLDDTGLDQYEAAALLQMRVHRVYMDVLRVLPWVSRLDEARQAVLVNMAYNMGVTGLLGFKNMLQAAQASLWDAAAAEMLQSQWATQVGERAVRLAQQMRSGEWV